MGGIFVYNMPAGGKRTPVATIFLTRIFKSSVEGAYVIIEQMKPSSDQLQNKTVYIVKIQTTGTQMDDEILELCLIDARDPWRGGDRKGDPSPVFHARFRPEYKTEWPRASRVNGITPSVVAKEHLLDEYRGELTRLFMNCDCLVGFNTGFEFAFLRRQFLFRANIMTVDLMRDWTEYVTKPSAPGDVSLRMPFLTQKDLFAHFDWTPNGTVSECLGIRHCFLKLIKMGAIHIRRPLLERRFNRISEQQLAEVQDSFVRLAGGKKAGPFLDMKQQGEDVEVSLGIDDPEHLLYDDKAPSLSLTVPGHGAALEVRDRIACALEASKGLPRGLVSFACSVLRDTLKTEDQEDEAKQDKETVQEAMNEDNGQNDGEA